MPQTPQTKSVIWHLKSHEPNYSFLVCPTPSLRLQILILRKCGRCGLNYYNRLAILPVFKQMPVFYEI